MEVLAYLKYCPSIHLDRKNGKKPSFMTEVRTGYLLNMNLTRYQIPTLSLPNDDVSVRQLSSPQSDVL